jgi:hypothetical protein
VPVNLRPPAHRHEIVGNCSSFVSIVTTPALPFAVPCRHHAWSSEVGKVS